jgi:dihydrofolate synthase/folylpolyglutamate synthase
LLRSAQSCEQTFVNYIEALRRLRQRDDWERTGSSDDAARWDLRRMRSLLARLGDPHLGRKTIHVAGSKGKGSVAAMIESLLRAAGVSTGLYTSPHLHRFTERIAVAGEPISEDDFARLIGELAPRIESEDASGEYGRVSTFEALTAVAFLAFRERGVEWQVLETGLGGRLDATNVFDAKEVCVLTPVSLEHTAVLGDTVPQIASEKAGIIKPGTTVVMAPQRESAADIFRATCAERGATLIEVALSCAMNRTGHDDTGQDMTLRTPQRTHKLRVPLLGRHQLENAATAVLALEQTGIDIDEAAVMQGLASLRWPGRIEIVRRRPLVVADGAHNRDSARRLAQTLRDDLGRSTALFVVGCGRDKDIEALADELAPLATHLIATRSRSPRSMAPREIAQAFAERETPVSSEDSVSAAADAALAMAGPGDAIVVCGSLFVAAEAREHLLGVAYDPTLDVGSVPDPGKEVAV